MIVICLKQMKEHNNRVNSDRQKLLRSFLAMQLLSAGYANRWLSEKHKMNLFEVYNDDRC